jgi:hypothetical protein
MSEAAPEVLVRSAGPVAAAGAGPSAGPGPGPGAVLLGRPIAEWRASVHEELGFPGGPVVGCGHQPEWWHPGIAAKFMWAAERAARDGAALAWLVIDTDVRDPAEVRVPVETDGRWSAVIHRFGPRVAPGTVPAGRPAFDVRGFEPAHGARPALPCVGSGLERMRHALAAARGAPDAVTQVIEALRACTPELGAPAAVVRSSALLGTGLGRAIVAHAERDPHACARAFNDALAAAPRAARRLETDGPGGPELPFWTPDAHGGRVRVTAGDLPTLRARGAALWPRAFLTGLLARTALFDRFVHGTGGDVYERATDAFARAWLGTALPPFDVATATLKLGKMAPGAIYPIFRRARWFDPAGDRHGASARKRAFLARIARAPRASAERRAAYRAMMEDVAAQRAADPQGILPPAATPEERARAAEDAVRNDRTWAIAFQPPEAVSRLQAAVRAHPS